MFESAYGCTNVQVRWRCDAIRICALLLAVCFATLVRAQSANLVTTPVSSTDRVILRDHHPSWANAQSDAGALPADMPLQALVLVLSRTPEREQAFEQFLKDQQNPSSPDFHHWLTPVEIGQRFGVSAHDIAAVKSWLESQGLHLDSVSSSMVRIRFSGSASAVGNAFGSEMHYYMVNGTKHVSISADAQIPTALASVIRSVSGLYTIDIHPMHGSRPGQITISHDASGSSPSPALTATCTGGITCHFVAPEDFATIYQLGQVYSGGTNGAGQTIAIVGQSDVDPADISNFQMRTGEPQVAPTVTVPPNGVAPPPPVTTTGSTVSEDQLEATLDVTRAGSVAPGAVIDLVISSQNSGGIGTASEWVVDTTPVPAQVMSISFGGCEAGAGSPGVMYWDNLFQQAAGEGISVFVASGDAGVAGCDAYFKPPVGTQVASPNYICSSSYATCVGGTEFADTTAQYWGPMNDANLGSATSYIPEGAWNEPLDGSGMVEAAATGGGVSSYIATPPWQAGPGVPIPSTGRYTPDISFTSAGHDGYFACLAGAGASCVGANGFQFEEFFGTSAAAPDMAGIAALLNQSQNQAQGNLNPILYKIAAVPSNIIFNDVTIATSGVTGCTLTTPSMCNNSTPGPSSLAGGLSGFLVGAGFDEATGLGSINVRNLLVGWSNFLVGVNSSATTLVSSANPAAAGSSVTFTATVTTETAMATGTVTFTDGSTVIGTATLAPGTVNCTTFTATVAFATTSLASGSHSITASYGGDVNFAVSTSSALAQVITGNNPAPHITSISPNSGSVGAAISEFTASGTNFLFGATIHFGGATVAAAVSSNGQLITANIPASAVNSPGAIGVTVANPTPGGGSSNSVNFTASNPVPVLGSLTPASAPINSAFVITANGSGFVTGSTLTFNGVTLAGTVSNGGTTLAATIAATSLTAVGTAPTTVTNPAPGGGTSNSINFAIVDFSLAGPTQPTTITAGNNASFPIVFAVQGGTLSAAATFSATNLPPNATMSFTATTVPAGTAASSTALTILTAAHTSSFVPPAKFEIASRPFILACFSLFAFAAFLALARKSSPAGRHKLQLCSAAALLVLCGALVSACGGGGSHGPTINPASGTPAGTYPITVTATSGAATRSTTVTLIVQ